MIMSWRTFLLIISAELVFLIVASSMIISNVNAEKHDLRKSSTIYHMNDTYRSEGVVEYHGGKYSSGRDLSFYDLKTGLKITISPPYKVISNQ